MDTKESKLFQIVPLVNHISTFLYYNECVILFVLSNNLYKYFQSNPKIYATKKDKYENLSLLLCPIVINPKVLFLNMPKYINDDNIITLFEEPFVSEKKNKYVYKLNIIRNLHVLLFVDIVVKKNCDIISCFNKIKLTIGGMNILESNKIFKIININYLPSSRSVNMWCRNDGTYEEMLESYDIYRVKWHEDVLNYPLWILLMLLSYHEVSVNLTLNTKIDNVHINVLGFYNKELKSLYYKTLHPLRQYITPDSAKNSYYEGIPLYPDIANYNIRVNNKEEGCYEKGCYVI